MKKLSELKISAKKEKALVRFYRRMEAYDNVPKSIGIEEMTSAKSDFVEELDSMSEEERESIIGNNNWNSMVRGVYAVSPAIKTLALSRFSGEPISATHGVIQQAVSDHFLYNNTCDLKGIDHTPVLEDIKDGRKGKRVDLTVKTANGRLRGCEVEYAHTVDCDVAIQLEDRAYEFGYEKMLVVAVSITKPAYEYIKNSDILELHTIVDAPTKSGFAMTKVK